MQLVVVAFRGTDRRRDSGGYLGYPAACGGVFIFSASSEKFSDMLQDTISSKYLQKIP
jgi:hypothetical protein